MATPTLIINLNEEHWQFLWLFYKNLKESKLQREQKYGTMRQWLKYNSKIKRKLWNRSLPRNWSVEYLGALIREYFNIYI